MSIAFLFFFNVIACVANAAAGRRNDSPYDYLFLSQRTSILPFCNVFRAITLLLVLISALEFTACFCIRSIKAGPAPIITQS